MEPVVFEELKRQGDMELGLRRPEHNRHIFKNVDVDASGTRVEEILVGPGESEVGWRLRVAF